MIWDSLHHLVLGHPIVLLTFDSYSNALLSTLILSIPFPWPNYYSRFTSNFITNFWITNFSLKIPLIILSYTSYPLHNTYSKVHHHNHREIKYTDNLFYTYCRHILLEVFYFQFSKWLPSCDKVLNLNLMTPMAQNSTLLDIKTLRESMAGGRIFTHLMGSMRDLFKRTLLLREINYFLLTTMTHKSLKTCWYLKLTSHM